MDDLLDLSFSSAPPLPPSGGAATSSASGSGTRTPLGGMGGPNKSSAFDFLASASSSGKNVQRYGVNGVNGSNGVSRSGTPISRSPLPLPLPLNTTTKPSGSSNVNDAFSSLLSFPTPNASGSINPSSSSSSPSTSSSSTFNPKPQHLSMAEQAMLRQTMEKEREERERHMFDFGQLGGIGGGGGDGGGGGESSSTSSGVVMGARVPVQVSISKVNGEDLRSTRINGITSGPSTKTTTGPELGPVQKEKKITLEDFDDVWELPTRSRGPPPPPLIVPPNATTSLLQRDFTSNTKIRDPWDFDELTASVPVNDSGGGSGSGGGGPLEGEEDFLGMLGKPVDHFVNKTPQSVDGEGKERREWKNKPNHSPSPHSPSSEDRDRTFHPSSSSTSTINSKTSTNRNVKRYPSPPPHILGRIVEMGFSVDQARRAFETTEGGLDVEAAMEVLLSGGSSGGVDIGRMEDDGRDRDRDRDREREREAEKRRRRRNGPTREEIPAEGSGTNTPLGIDADKLLNQATELGKGFLGKASGLWSVGKERAMKVYEERTAAAAAAGGGAGREGNGRPKWMVDSPVDEDEGRFGGENGRMRSRVDREEGSEGRWDDDAILSGGRSTPRSNGPSQREPARESRQPAMDRGSTPTNTTSDMSLKEKTAALFNDAAPVYRSAARRRPGSGRETPRSSTPSIAPTPVRPPSPLRIRPIIPVAPQQVTTSAKHKTLGNDHFKLGKFAEAVIAYSKAIDALPDGHLLRVPLHNNRATAYLKSGGHTEAIQDCTIVIEVIGVEYHPAKEQALPADVQEVKLADSLVKALNKRATGHEMAEKWDLAKGDWERLVRVLSGGVGVEFGAERVVKERALAMEGLGRCKKMEEVLRGAVKSAASNGKRTKPPTRSSTPANPDSSAAVSRLRLAAEAQDKEDTLRLGLKDKTDARLLAWSSGKETNLRGLLSSLDGVLGGDEGWKALGIKKLGMADLVTDKQVKLGYMKVIGKVHPDKLNTTTTTLEQRMIANGVFGTLNEAWHAFQG